MAIFEAVCAVFELGANAAYIEDLYEQYLVDPDSVGATWKAWFDGFKGREAGDVPHSVVMDAVARAGREAKAGVVTTGGASGGDLEAQRKQGSVLKLITAYRSRGHLQADTDPLGMAEKIDAPDLDLPFHGLSDADLDTEFATGPGAAPAPSVARRGCASRLPRCCARPMTARSAPVHAHPAGRQRRWMTRNEQAAAAKDDSDEQAPPPSALRRRGPRALPANQDVGRRLLG